MKLAFDWGVSSYYGWGVYGLNLALELADSPVEALTTQVVDRKRLGIDALRLKAIEPFLKRSALAPIADLSDVLMLHALGNDVLPESTAKVGVIFFEEMLTSQAVERAKRYDLIVTGSSWNEDVLRRHGIDQVKTVLQGVDPTLFHPAPRCDLFDDRFVIFSGGKAEPRKGQDLVVKAFRRFAARHSDALLVTAWHSPWPALAAGMDLDLSECTDQVIDVGAVPNTQMAQVYRECNVALFPNRAEGGTNLVAMECLACGVPSILSANTGHRDLLALPGVHAIGERESDYWCGWGECDVDEIVAALELAYQKNWQPTSSAVFPLTWRRTVAELLEAVAPYQPAKSIAA